MNIQMSNVESLNVSKIYIDGGWLTAAELERLIKRLRRVLKEMRGQT